MKKGLLLASIVVLMSGCAAIELPKPFTKIKTVDYSWFKDQGIFVTESNSVSFDYEAKGSVRIVASSGYLPKDPKKQVVEIEYGDDIYNTYITDTSQKRKWRYVPVEIGELFSDLANTLKEMDANGVVNFKIEETKINDRNMTIISGMAIKK